MAIDIGDGEAHIPSMEIEHMTAKRGKRKGSPMTNLTSESQLRATRNHRARLAQKARKEFPNELMTPDEYRDSIARLGLTPQRAGLWLGLSMRQGQRYTTGEAEIPSPVAKLIRLMLRDGYMPEMVP